MKNTQKLLCTAISVLALSACGSSSSGSDSTTVDDVATDTIYGPYATGSVSEPNFVYFDLETMSAVDLTDIEAESNTVWDVAFKRSGVYLNANTDTPVSAYFTDNNSDFYDTDGNAVTDLFIAATPETELEDFSGVTVANIPTDETMFVSDETNNIIDGFYNYNSTTHQVTAAADKFYIVSSDDTFTKFNVTDLSQAGYYMGSLTVSYANQTTGSIEFDTSPTELIVDAAAACAGYGGIYIDFDLGQTVSEGDDWDITLSCDDALTGANFDINIADDATAMQDFDNYYTAVDAAAINYYDFESNQYTVKAFDANPWYAYGVNGGHTLWSQYGVYLIQTETATYKLQITSYYNAEGTSGNLSFRAEAL